MNARGSGHAAMTAADQELLGSLRRMWEERDPAPTDLADLVSFSLELESFDVDLLRLVERTFAPAGTRAEECTRTVTFSSESLSVMIIIDSDLADAIRVDGWISEGGFLRVGLRRTDSERLTDADEDGRFSFDAVPPGFAQLVFHPTEGAGVALGRVVVTPTMKF